MKNRRISLESLVYAVDLETAEMGWYTLRQKDTVNTILRLPPEGVIQALNDQIVDQHPWGRFSLSDSRPLSGGESKSKKASTGLKILNLLAR